MWGRFENDEMMDCDVDPQWATHPSLRDVVANLSLLAHIVSRNHKCPLRSSKHNFLLYFKEVSNQNLIYLS